MAAKRLRKSGTWEYVVRRKGMKTLYLTFDSEKEGDLYVKQLEARIEQGAAPQKEAKQRGSLANFIDEYLATGGVNKNDVAILEALRTEIGARSAEGLIYSWAEEWVRSMKKDLAPSTIRHKVGALARCLDWVVRMEKMAVHPLRALPKGYASKEGYEEERDRRLMPGEEEKIRPLLDEVMQVMFDLALETAMRMKETYTLEWRQVDLGQCTIFLEKTKNGSRRQVPLSSVALRVLKQHKKKATDDYVFPWRGEEKKVTAMLSARWRRLFEDAECIDLRYHDLRHEATSRLFERTQLSDTKIAKITGHKDPRMLARYSNLRGSNLAAELW